MAILLKNTVTTQWLSKVLDISLAGPDRAIESVAPFNEFHMNSLSFSTKIQDVDVQMTVIGPEGWISSKAVIVPVKNPRLAFIMVLNAIDKTIGFHVEDADPIIDTSVALGHNVVIGKGVVIGAGTVIYHNVVIGRGVKIGKNCRIKSGTVIGEEGFGFERDASGVPHRMPHLGSVVIGDDVEVGSLCTICRGALSDTMIGSHAKIDDHCHIAHNDNIDENTMIGAGAVLSGSVRVGNNTWIAPNSTVINKGKIGNEAFVGIGAVVVRDVADHAKVFGNPAKSVPLQNS